MKQPIETESRSAHRMAVLGMAQILAGAASACLAMVNFPQATVLALLLVVVLSIAELKLRANSATRNQHGALLILAGALLLVLGPGGFGGLLAKHDASLLCRLLHEWQILDSWLVPLCLCLYWPLQLVACLA